MVPDLVSDPAAYVTEVSVPIIPVRVLQQLHSPMKEPEPEPVVPASSLKHPACGSAVESLPQAGLVSSQEPGGFPR